jgi:cytochrome bd-type quinol oxidase subunit 2
MESEPTAAMNARINLSIAQNRLATVWLTGSAAIFALVLIQTVAGKYGGQTQRAWAWFLPTVVPTLSVILSAIAYTATKSSAEQSVEDRAYRLTLWLSVFYLVVVLSTLLLQPLSDLRPLEFMATSNLWLGPLQGLVGIGLGTFFTSKE